jgi:hypothetical protein
MTYIPDDILAKAAEVYDATAQEWQDPARVIALAILEERQKWSATLQAATDPKWRTIETAPKDAPILAFENGCVPIAYISWWVEEHGKCWWTDSPEIRPDPTHWIPIPQFPNTPTHPHRAKESAA